MPQGSLKPQTCILRVVTTFVYCICSKASQTLSTDFKFKELETMTLLYCAAMYWAGARARWQRKGICHDIVLYIRLNCTARRLLLALARQGSPHTTFRDLSVSRCLCLSSSRSRARKLYAHKLHTHTTSTVHSLAHGNIHHILHCMYCTVVLYCTATVQHYISYNIM